MGTSSATYNNMNNNNNNKHDNVYGAVIMACNEVGTLAVDWWAVTFGTARRGLGGAVTNVTAHPSTTCTNHRIAV